MKPPQFMELLNQHQAAQGVGAQVHGLGEVDGFYVGLVIGGVDGAPDGSVTTRQAMQFIANQDPNDNTHATYPGTAEMCGCPDVPTDWAIMIRKEPKHDDLPEDDAARVRRLFTRPTMGFDAYIPIEQHQAPRPDRYRRYQPSMMRPPETDKSMQTRHATLAGHIIRLATGLQ